MTHKFFETVNSMFYFFGITVKYFAAGVLILIFMLSLLIALDGSVVLPSPIPSQLASQKCEVTILDSGRDAWEAFFSAQDKRNAVSNFIKFFAVITVECQPMASEYANKETQYAPNELWNNPIVQMSLYFLFGVLCGYGVFR